MYIRQLQSTMNKWTSFSFFYYYLYMTFYYVGYNYNHELNKLQLEMIVENAEHHSYLWTRDTRMRQNGRHTRVQCDLTRRRARYASACASNRVQFFFFFFFVSGFAPTLAEPGRFAPNQIVSAEYRCVLARKRKLAGEKKKNLKPKIPVDLIRCCRRLHWP